MQKKEEKDIRDIYQAEEIVPENFLDPKALQALRENQLRDLRRNQIAPILLGVTTLAFAVVLAVFVIRDFLNGLSATEPVKQKPLQEKTYKPLELSSLWIMDYPVDQGTSDETSGEKPLSAQWVKTAAYYTIEGQIALNLNRLKDAADQFQKVVEIYPNLKGIHFTLGVIYFSLKEHPKAVHHLEKAVQEEETFPVLHNLGMAYIETEQFDLAEKNLKRAVELAPENPESHKGLADLYKKTNRPKDAVYHFEKYTDMRPDDIDTRQKLALYLTEQGLWKQAEEVLTGLTKDVPDVAPLHFLLTQAQIQNNQPEKALESLKRGALLLDPNLALTWIQRAEFKPLSSAVGFKQLADQLQRPAE